jgi:hypothetical protein
MSFRPTHHSPLTTHRAWALFIISVLFSLSLAHPALAACTTKDDCKPGETCGDNKVCIVVPPGTACVNNGTCGLTHECKDGKCAAPEVRQGVTTVENVKSAPPVIPQLNVPIPGLTFGSDSGAFFAQYVSGVYRYMISVVAVAATVMFTFGAFLYLLGSAITSIKKGKQYMIDAVVGMLLVLGAVFILRTINPGTVTMQSILVTPVSPLDIGGYSAEVPLGTAPVPYEAGKAPTFSKAEIVQAIVKAAKEAGVDPCTMVAVCDHETGLRSIWSGKGPMETATSYGPCQVAVGNIKDRAPIVKLLRQDYPDFPAPQANPNVYTPSERTARGNWLLNNLNGSARVAAYIFKANSNIFGGNEITALGGYGAGAKSIQLTMARTGCSPVPGLKVKDANSDSDPLGHSCVPHIAAIPTLGDPPQGCPGDKDPCGNAKQNARSEFQGTCEDGRLCYAMVTDGYALDVIRRYPRMVSTYKCNQ